MKTKRRQVRGLAAGAEVEQAAMQEAALAPPGVMDTLVHITAMPAGPGFDALMQLVDQRYQVLPLLSSILVAFPICSIKRSQKISHCSPSTNRNAAF